MSAKDYLQLVKDKLLERKNAHRTQLVRAEMIAAQIEVLTELSDELERALLKEAQP